VYEPDGSFGRFVVRAVRGWTLAEPLLAVPIAVHVGLDIPLYYGNACRIA
jgi:hypothetical protein